MKKKVLFLVGLIIMALAWGMNTGDALPVGPILVWLGGFILSVGEGVLIILKKDGTP